MTKIKHSIEQPFIFISHSHYDADLAEMLFDCLLNGFELNTSEIACSSNVENNTSNVKTIVVDVLEKIKNSKIVIALISIKGLASPWVMFEIGAAWAYNKEIIPILSNGINIKDKRLGPILYKVCWSTTTEKSYLRLKNRIKQVAYRKDLKFKDSSYFERQLTVFVHTLNNWGNIHADFSQTTLDVEIDGLHIDNTIEKNFTVNIKTNNFPSDGYLWIAVIADKRDLFYLKEPIKNGTAFIRENGTPISGEFKVLIIGVGKSGNDKLENVYKKIQGSGGHIKERSIETIPGGVVLKKIDGLTVILKK